MKSFINSTFSAMGFLSTPRSSRPPREVFQDGLILEETYLFSGSKPRCATWTKVPSLGPGPGTWDKMTHGELEPGDCVVDEVG